MNLIEVLGYLRSAYYALSGQGSQELKDSLLTAIKLASKELSDSIAED